MRDDLSGLFQELILLNKEKLSFLDKISFNEVQLRYHLHAGNISEIFDLLQVDNDLFVKLDSLEYDSRILIENICKAAGIDRNNFNDFFLKRPEEPLPELEKQKEAINNRISALIKERDKLIIDMEKKLKEIKVDIYSLKKIREFGSD